MSISESFLDNFPTGFVPRLEQKTILQDIQDAVKSNFRNIILCAPTGIGKSHIAVASAKSIGSSFIITAQKILQDQYTKDFPSILPVKGKSNFPCLDLYYEQKLTYEQAANDPTLSCSKGVCSWVERGNDGTDKTIQCKYKPEKNIFSVTHAGTDLEIVSIPDETTCHYYLQKYRALNATHSIFNYPSYFQTRKYSQGIQEYLDRDCIIADESHEIESQIIDFIGSDITQRYLNDVNLDFDNFDIKGIDNIKNLIRVLGDEYDKRANDLKNDETDPQRNIYEYRRDKMDSLLTEIRLDAENLITQYNSDDSNKINVIHVKPINISRYVDQFFDAKFNIFVSATINKRMFCKTMGIDESTCAFIDVPKSPFAAKHRKIEFLNLKKLNYNTTNSEYAVIYQKINELLQLHSNEKGLILTTNKKQCFDLFDHVSDPSRLKMVHGDVEQQREEIIRQHATTSAPQVLVSPSLWYGVDLKDDLSRFQIILKTPYPSLADERTKIKAAKQPLWYQYVTLIKLLQGFGRSIRNDKDYAITYVIDTSAHDLIHKMRLFVPKSYDDILQIK